jgi:hypothetical protein
MAAIGFALLRWGMTRTEVFATYPSARVTPTYQARHPLTGEEFLVGGEVLVPEIAEAVPGMMVNATLGFDAGDRLVEIELWPDGDRDDLVTPAIHALARALGVGPVDEDDDEQSWTAGGITITLSTGDGFRFEMAPATSGSRGR